MRQRASLATTNDERPTINGFYDLLNMLLLDDLDPNDKTERLAKEFGIIVTPYLEKGVAEMCNLSEGIERRGEERGELLAKKSAVLEMLKDGLSFEKIAQYTKLSLQAIEGIAKNSEVQRKAEKSSERQ